MPIRVMIRMLQTTYGESVICTPRAEMCEPSGPIENGMTYIVRPRMQPRNKSVRVVRISSGSRQLLVGPASTCSFEQMIRAVLDPGHVAGVGQRQEAVRPLRRVQLLERALVDHQAASAGPTPRPSRRTTPPGPAWSAPLPRPPSRATDGAEWEHLSLWSYSCPSVFEFAVWFFIWRSRRGPAYAVPGDHGNGQHRYDRPRA